MFDISVIIPACNEAPVIARTLLPLKGQGFQIIVVANGCIDDTALVARTTCPEGQIIDSPIGCKSMAINLALALACGRTLILLDADITTSADAIHRLDQALCDHPQAELAYGDARFCLDHSSLLVRQFYRAWQTNSYFASGKVGGCYALRRSAIAEAGGFPRLTNDDEWVRRRFGHRAQRVAGAAYDVQAPRYVADLIAVRRRVTAGNKQLRQKLDFEEANQHSGWRATAFATAKSPSLWVAALIYAAVSLYVRVFPARAGVWHRDLSNRQI